MSGQLRQISMFSYGSGCAASMNIAYPTPGFERFRDKVDPEPELNVRRKLDIEEYENITRISDSLGTGDTEEFNADEWDLTGDFLYLGNRNHVRQYSDLKPYKSYAMVNNALNLSKDSCL